MRHRPTTGEPPGMQAERTALAWRRTGLVVVGIAALLVHGGPTLAWAATLLAGVGLLVATEDRLRRVTAGMARGSVAPARTLALALTVGSVLLAGVGALTVLRA